jgi:hypothetical protein
MTKNSSGKNQPILQQAAKAPGRELSYVVLAKDRFKED